MRSAPQAWHIAAQYSGVTFAPAQRSSVGGHGGQPCAELGPSPQPQAPEQPGMP